MDLSKKFDLAIPTETKRFYIVSVKLDFMLLQSYLNFNQVKLVLKKNLTTMRGWTWLLEQRS
jgi:hypothetical protein